jgi:NitT/TauT family transport system substrate-binding protein
MKHTVLPAAAAVLLGATPALAQDAVTFGTNWVAQAEHGGYYQAVATGIYEAFGLDVTIRPGGPQINHRQMLVAGNIDFLMGSNNSESYNFVVEDLPFLSVAAIFQKDPQVWIAHASQGWETMEDLKNASSILISADARTSYWPFMVKLYGYPESLAGPYNFSAAPFLADETIVMQGYLTSEPFSVAEAGGDPQVFLLADHGYSPYSTLITTSRKLVDENPDLVQRFVDASILGWYSYLYGDPAPANALIKADNPDMSDAQIAYSIDAMKQYGIVDSGDTLELGIGAMTDARWGDFFRQSVEIGQYDADLEYQRAYSLDFVNDLDRLKAVAAEKGLDIPFGE